VRVAQPALHFAPELLLRAQGVRAAIFDVDGVLTDGRLYIGEHGETVKTFHTLDGHGIKLLAAGGIEPIVVSGRDSSALRRRLSDLGVTRIALGAGDKLAVATPLLQALQLDWAQLGPTCHCCNARDSPARCLTRMSRCARSRTTSPLRAVGAAQHASSATCCCVPPGAMPSCCRRSAQAWT
jgi:hypothetical protein